MNNDQYSASFNNISADKLVVAQKLDEVNPVYKSQSQESWCCAWSPDCSYIAWSQGGGFVYLLPWDRDAARITNKPICDLSDEDLDEIKDEEELLQNLPRIAEEEPSSHVTFRVSDSCSSIDSWLSEIGEDEAKRQACRIDCGSNVWCLAFGSGCSENNVNVWRRFNNHDLILATGLENGKIKLWNVLTGQKLMDLLDHKNIVRGLDFSSDGSLKLVSCSNDCTIKFWDLLNDGNMFKTVRFDSNTMVFDCKWSPNNQQMAAVGMIKNAYIWNTKTFSKIKLSGHLHHVAACDFSPDGAILATCSYDTSTILWDPYTGDNLRTLYHLFPPPRPIYAGGANGHYVRSVSFCRDGMNIATTADDGYVRFWNLNDVTNPQTIASVPDVLCCAYSPNGHVLLTGDRTGKMKLFHAVLEVPSLQELSRQSIRKILPTKNIDRLSYPIALKQFLKYMPPY